MAEPSSIDDRDGRVARHPFATTIMRLGSARLDSCRSDQQASASRIPGRGFRQRPKTTNWPEHKIGHIAPLIRGGLQTEPFSQHFRENDFSFPCWEVKGLRLGGTLSAAARG